MSSKSVVRTVLGPVDPGEWGVTSMEDYLLFDGSIEADHLRARLPQLPYPVKPEDPVTLENVGMLYRNYVLCKDAALQTDPGVLTDEVREFRRVGGHAILDLAVPGVSVDPSAVRAISLETGVPIVASTGCYTRETWPAHMAQSSIEDHRSRLLKEIFQGIGGTDVRAGHICVVVSGLCEDERRGLRAAAQVSQETGLALTVVQPLHSDGLDDAILAVLREERVSPERVIFGGVPLTNRPPMRRAIRHPKELRVDTARARRLMDWGYQVSCSFRNRRWVELLGEYDWGSWPELSGLVQLIEAGCADRLVLGNDCRSKICLRSFGGNGYCRMLHFTVPTLRNIAGISDHAITQMLVRNPARLLSCPEV